MTGLEKKLTETVEKLEQENEFLRQKIDLLVRKVFGKSSEQLDLDQLLLFEDNKAKKPEGDDPAIDADESSPKPRRNRTSREATLPDNLPVEETVLIPDEVRLNPRQYRRVGEETQTQWLDTQPDRPPLPYRVRTQETTRRARSTRTHPTLSVPSYLPETG